ncbi:hypothetical protein D3C87_1614760 [compost metagenome]
MKTTTTLSSGAFSKGLTIANWIAAPMENDTSTVAAKASQYGTPACSKAQAMKAEKVAISPWAKLMWWVAW